MVAGTAVSCSQHRLVSSLADLYKPRRRTPVSLFPSLLVSFPTSAALILARCHTILCYCLRLLLVYTLSRCLSSSMTSPLVLRITNLPFPASASSVARPPELCCSAYSPSKGRKRPIILQSTPSYL
jgi:hypothetical protein